MKYQVIRQVGKGLMDVGAAVAMNASVNGNAVQGAVGLGMTGVGFIADAVVCAKEHKNPESRLNGGGGFTFALDLAEAAGVGVISATASLGGIGDETISGVVTPLMYVMGGAAAAMGRVLDLSNLPIFQGRKAKSKEIDIADNK